MDNSENGCTVYRFTMAEMAEDARRKFAEDPSNDIFKLQLAIGLSMSGGEAEAVELARQVCPGEPGPEVREGCLPEEEIFAAIIRSRGLFERMALENLGPEGARYTMKQFDENFLWPKDEPVS